MSNPLKFLTSVTASSGLAVTGSSGLIVKQGGLTVEAGSITLPALSVSVDALSSKTLTIGSSSLSVGGAALTSIDNLTTLDTTNLDVSNIRAKDGAAAITISDSTGIVTITNLSASTIDINGGTIDGVSITATTLSASSTLQVGGASTLAGGATVTGGALNASTVAVSASALNVAGAASVGGNLTVTGDLQVEGSLNAVNRTDLYVTDKVILVASGSANAAAADGAGLSVSIAGVADPSFTWNQAGKWVSTEDLDLASGKAFKINGTTVLDGSSLGSGITSATGITSLGTITSLTASALNVTGLAKLDGNVNLGNASSDVISALGQLTASEGVDISTGKALLVGGKNVVSDYISDLSGYGGGAGSYASASYISYGTTPGAIYVGHISASGYQMDTDIVQLSFDGSFASGYGIQIDKDEIFLGGGGLGNGVTVMSASSNVAIRGEKVHLGPENRENGANVTASVNGLLQVSTNGGSFSFVSVGTSEDENGNTFNSIDVLGAINELDAKLNEVSGATGGGGGGIGSGDYYGLRGSWVQGVYSGYSGVYRVKFSGSGNSSDQNNYSVPAIVGLTASSEATLLDNLGYASFDVASRDSGSMKWTNDLISIQVSASQEGSTGYWYPVFEITAPGLNYDGSQSVKLRLIVVNEKANVLA